MTSLRAIIHLDMDCFFAAVCIRDRPELRGLPLAVAHSHSAAGNGEISCVTYEARRFGVRAGMWMQDARERCESGTRPVQVTCACMVG